MSRRGAARWSAGRRGVRAGLTVALFLAAIAVDAPAADMSVKLRLLEGASRMAEGDWTLVTLGMGRLSLAASSANVKAEVAVDAIVGDGIVASLARASVGVRFPTFRLTLGKARLSWGEGAAFNAADLLFGAGSATGLDLTADAIRDDAAWLAAAYVPFGRFSFAEAVVLPPPVDVAAFLADPLAAPRPSELALGGRVVGKLAGTKMEAAYLFRGAELEHHAAVSMQGNLFVDWHLSAAASVPAVAPEARDFAEGLRLSAGIFHLQRLGDRAKLSLRLETLVAPAGSWAEEEPPASPVYGILLYPEFAIDIDDVVSVTARALLSPVDGSAWLVPGVSLSLHKGLVFLGMASIGVGDATDSYAFDRAGGLSLLVGCAYTY